MSDIQNTPEILRSYPVIVTVPVQWGDQDAFAHVNNTVYLRWFEIGRIAYFQRIGVSHLKADQTLAPILAAVSCSFERQVTFPDVIRIGSRVTRIGNTSATIEHLIFSEAQAARVAYGTSTIVYYDYAANRSCPIDETLRNAIRSLESNPDL